MKKESFNYLINLIPNCEQIIRRRDNHIQSYHRRTDCFKYSFFLSTLNDWFKLDENIKNSESIAIFKSRLLPFIRPAQSNIYHIFDPRVLKFLTCLWLGLSHLNEHKFHNFQDCLNPLYSCNLEIEDTVLLINFCTVNTFITIVLILWIV